MASHLLLAFVAAWLVSGTLRAASAIVLNAHLANGMPNLAVLRAATLEPARHLGMADSVGVIAPGMLADLVLLDANPLVDIRNVRRIHSVIANGRYYDSAARRELIRRAKP